MRYRHVEIDWNEERTQATAVHAITDRRLGGIYRRGDGQGWVAIAWNTLAKPIDKISTWEKALDAVIEMSDAPVDDEGFKDNARDHYGLLLHDEIEKDLTAMGIGAQ